MIDMNREKLLEINELMSKVLTGKIEHLREARKAKTLLEELIKNCKECVHFDGSQHFGAVWELLNGYGYCDVHEEIMHETDSCMGWEQ